jgi:uncharacterized damage-inducible protein DinB
MPADILDRLLGHNVWATRLLIEYCRALTPEQYIQKFDIGPGSLHVTLTHCVAVMLFYADQLAGKPMKSYRDLEQRATTPESLLDHLATAERNLARAASRVRDERRLDEVMTLTTRDGRFWSFSRGTCVVHVLTHGVHHRAQALNMLRRLGVAGLPDLDTVDWELKGGDKIAAELRELHEHVGPGPKLRERSSRGKRGRTGKPASRRGRPASRSAARSVNRRKAGRARA